MTMLPKGGVLINIHTSLTVHVCDTHCKNLPTGFMYIRIMTSTVDHTMRVKGHKLESQLHVESKLSYKQQARKEESELESKQNSKL